MNHQKQFIFKTEHDPFSNPLDGLDAFSVRGIHERIERSKQEWPFDHDARQHAIDHARPQHAEIRLDVGQFGHGFRLPRS